LLDQYAPASEAELHLTHDVIRAFWLSNHWKLRRLDAKKKQKAFLAANPGSPPCPELKREDEFARWHSIKQSLFLARRRELFNQIRQQYEADLVAAGYTLEEARSAFWQAAPSAEAEHPELPCAA
jgi:membrane-bound lytic murein transglycosylase MltF